MARWVVRVPIVILIVLVFASLLSALTASNSIPSSRAGNPSDPVTAEKLKPSQCDALVLSATVTGSGTFTATGANELVLASANADRPDARGGNDCILGGAGNDDLTGGAGTDVCLGQGGNDDFTGCETAID